MGCFCIFLQISLFFFMSVLNFAKFVGRANRHIFISSKKKSSEIVRKKGQISIDSLRLLCITFYRLLSNATITTPVTDVALNVRQF